MTYSLDRLRCLALGAALMLGGPALADANYPDKPIRLVVALAAGGSADTIARMVADHLRTTWKQPVLIDNKPGANTAIGSSFVAKAAPDGLTLLFTSQSLSTINLYVKNPGFDPLKDLVPVTQVAKGDYVLSTSKDFPVDSLAQFAAYAQKNPDKVFHGAGAGVLSMVYEKLAGTMKFKVQQVNYRGEVPALTALASGEVQMVVSSLLAARPFIEAGRIKPLAIPTTVRSPMAPQIPTAAESGLPNFSTDFWFGITAPAGTPPAIRKKIADELALFLAKPATRQKFLDVGFVARSSSAAEFGKMIEDSAEQWAEIAKRAGIEPQ
jgi:tripartite-type tricarboxylate transporter receptor subunit TctC